MRRQPTTDSERVRRMTIGTPSRRLRSAGGAAVVALVVAACATNPSPPPTQGQTVSASVSPATPSVSPTTGGQVPPPSPVGGDEACSGDDLALEIGPWEGAAGSRFVVVTARTIDDISCTLQGRPGVALLDGDGTIIVDSTTDPAGQPRVEPGDPLVTIGIDQGATVGIGARNWCGPTPPLPIGVLLTLPDESSAPFIPAIGSPDNLPPCNDPAGPAQVFVQLPWQPQI